MLLHSNLSAKPYALFSLLNFWCGGLLWLLARSFLSSTTARFCYMSLLSLGALFDLCERAV